MGVLQKTFCPDSFWCPTMVVVAFDIPTELMRELRKEAEERNVSLSEVCRERMQMGKEKLFELRMRKAGFMLSVGLLFIVLGALIWIPWM
jgi:hypothetical protein